ncbi:MAG: ABC transporter permease [Betaproteobacteria bacterium]|nr:ABC transporter permease [Betaproteobacteria bacterium]
MSRRGAPLDWALGAWGIAFLAVLYLPIALVLAYSFNRNVVNMMVWEGFTLDWYRSIFGLATRLAEDASYVHSTEGLVHAARNSVVVALAATAVSTVVGTATALAMARHRFRLRPLYQALLVMPMVMPDIVLGVALLVFFVGAGMTLGLGTIVMGHCVFLASYVFVVVSARLAGMGADLEEASADLGAGPWTTFRRVTLPQVAPGVAGGALLAFIISMDDLVITYFIAGVESTTLPVFIYGMLRRGMKPEINAIAMLLLAFSFVIAATGLWLRARRR